MDPFAIADAMGRVARDITSPRSMHDVLDRIVHAARDNVPGVDSVSISVIHRKGGVETLVFTDDLAIEADKVQYELDEGPCLDAIRVDDFERSDDLSDEERWPRFAPRAAELGVGSQMAIKMYTDDRTLGGLNMYATEPHAFNDDTHKVADVFAAHAAIAMGKARERETLNEALGTRTVIGAAVGMIMERYTLDQDRAFGFLTRVSQDANVKIIDIAREMVEQARRPAKA